MYGTGGGQRGVLWLLVAFASSSASATLPVVCSPHTPHPTQTAVLSAKGAAALTRCSATGIIQHPCAGIDDVVPHMCSEAVLELILAFTSYFYTRNPLNPSDLPVWASLVAAITATAAGPHAPSAALASAAGAICDIKVPSNWVSWAGCFTVSGTGRRLHPPPLHPPIPHPPIPHHRHAHAPNPQVAHGGSHRELL
jgi:hypothetical protein